MSETAPEARKPVVSTIRIRGLAEREDSPEQPLGPEVIVPQSVPLRIESGSGVPVGIAHLHRDARGIWVDAEISPDTGMDRVPQWHGSHHPADLWPKLAVGVARALSEKNDAHPAGVITSGRIVCICLVRENLDTSLPPWEVVTDPPGECGRCGTTLEYRDRFLRHDGRWSSDKVPDPFCAHCEDDWRHLNQLCHSDLRFCGCGDPESVYELVRDLLGLFQERSDAWERERQEHPPFGSPGSNPAGGIAQQINDRIGGGDGTYYAVLYWLDGSGLIEHGGSVGGSWLTAKGKYYLSLMRMHDWDDGPGSDEGIGLPHEGNGCGPGCRHWEASTEEWQKRESAESPP